MPAMMSTMRIAALTSLLVIAACGGGGDDAALPIDRDEGSPWRRELFHAGLVFLAAIVAATLFLALQA